MLKTFLSSVIAVGAIGLLSSVVIAKEIPAGTTELRASSPSTFSITENLMNGERQNRTETIDVSLSSIYSVTKNIGFGATAFYNKQSTKTGYLKSSSSLKSYGDEGNYQNSKTVMAYNYSKQSYSGLGPTVKFNTSVSDRINLNATGSFYLIRGERGREDFKGTGYIIGGNVSYFLNDFFSINTGVAYSLINIFYNEGNKNKTKSYSVGTGLSVYF